MASVRIPLLTGSDDFSHVVTLDGTDYQIRFRWNSRDEGWMLDIRDAVGTDLLNGIAVRVDVPLNGQHVAAALPPGYLIAVDSSGQGVEIEEPDDLGTRVQLLYVPQADL